MAKETKSIAFSNATIDLADDTITEYKKDSMTVSCLSEVLKAWDGVGGISLSIRTDENVQVPTADGTFLG